MKFIGRTSVILVFGLTIGCGNGSGGGAGVGGDSGQGGDGNAAGGDSNPGTGGTAGGSDGGNAGTPPTGGGGGASSAGGRTGGANPDAGAGGAPPDAGGPPVGTVPMFVAAGHAGRTVTSCDDGRTWKVNDFSIASGEEANDKGLAFGHGVFMRVLGWGGQCSFMRSEDGVTWQRISLAQAGLPNMSECGGITYNGDGFSMVHWGGETYASDHDGLKWKKVGMFNNNNEHVREVVGDGPSPGIILAGGANDPSGTPKNPPHVSVDGGKTWKTTPGCSTFNAISIGQEGGGALGGGRLVFVGFRGQVCTSTDMAAWQEAQIPGLAGNPVQGKVSFDGALFWLADNSRVVVSPDGLAWTERKLPTGVRLQAVASNRAGTWVGFNRATSVFYRSTDGLAWTAATTSPPDGPDLYRMVFGYGKPSAQCPLK